MMYLHFIGDQINYYNTMPVKIRTEDGTAYTNLDEMTEQERNDIGLYTYIDVTSPYNPALYYPNGDITWDHENRTFVRSLTEIPIPEPSVKQFTQLEYQTLYTFDELVAIEMASENDPVLRVLQRMQSAATFITLNDPRTIQGMQILVSKELLTPERYDEILTHTYDT